MATGILGAANLPSGTPTILYTVPNETFSVITINVTNRNTNSVNIRIAISDSATPNDADYIEYDTELLANGVIERSGVVVDAGKNIIVFSDSANVNAISYGIETPTS